MAPPAYRAAPQETQRQRAESQHLHGIYGKHHLMGKSEGLRHRGGYHQAEYYPVVSQGSEVIKDVIQHGLALHRSRLADVPEVVEGECSQDVTDSHDQEGNPRLLALEGNPGSWSPHEDSRQQSAAYLPNPLPEGDQGDSVDRASSPYYIVDVHLPGGHVKCLQSAQQKGGKQ